MGWATGHIEKLLQGERVQFRPKGSSMAGKVESGQLCTVDPMGEGEALEVGDIVLCKVKGKQYLHLVTAVQGERVQISNNKGHVNGWIGKGAVFGKLVRIEP